METVASPVPRPRDPFGSSDLYAAKLSSAAKMISISEADMLKDGSAKNVSICREMIANEEVRAITHWYAAGHDAPAVMVQIERMLHAIETAMRLREACEGLRPYRSPLALSAFVDAMRTYAVFAFVVCLSPSMAPLRRFLQLLDRSEPERLFDLLAHAFVPQHEAANKYPKMPWVQTWTQPVLAALSQPADKRAAALAAHMKNWPALMRPFGLKTKPREYHDLFPYFAFDVALAVCACDIDDSSFRDNPHYPRDLVEHYRTHVRHTRDADRPLGLEPGLPPMEISKPPRADLAKSKRKGIARWVELVTDGDSEAAEMVLEKVGKPRKVADAWDLMCALSEEVHHAVHADIKDDATSAAQAEMLARHREIGEFVPPQAPPEGPARATKTLLAFDAWLSERGHRLVGIDNDDDAFHAVVVRAAYLDELLALSASLGIRAQTADAAFDES